MLLRKADTATRLKALLAAIDDPDRLAGISDHVIGSDDGDELLSCVMGAGTELRFAAPETAARSRVVPVAERGSGNFRDDGANTRGSSSSACRKG